MAEAPASVVGAQKYTERLLSHDVVQCGVHGRRAVVHHGVVILLRREEIRPQSQGRRPGEPGGLFDRGGERLNGPHPPPNGAIRNGHHIVPLPRRPFGRQRHPRVPARPELLVRGEALVHPRALPLVVRQEPIGELMPDLVHHERPVFLPIHDEHGELGPAGLQPFGDRELRPGVGAVNRFQPGQRMACVGQRAPWRPAFVQHVQRHRVPTGAAVAGANVAPTLVPIVGGHTPPEMMHIAGNEAHLAIPRRTRRARGPLEPCRLIGPPGVRRHRTSRLPNPLPAGIAAHRHAGGRNHLVRGEHEGHVEGAKLPVQLSLRYERVRLPAVAIVHGHLGKPLCEVEVPAATSLPARYSTRPCFPRQLHLQRLPGRERLPQFDPHDRAVRGQWIAEAQRLPVGARRRDEPFEGVVGVVQSLKALPALRLIIGAPA